MSPTASAMSPASNAARHQTSATSPPQRPWPLVRRKRPDGSEGVLLDNYSTVVSDSDSSGNELQPAPQSLLRGISAKQIQSSKQQLSDAHALATMHCEVVAASLIGLLAASSSITYGVQRRHMHALCHKL